VRTLPENPQERITIIARYPREQMAELIAGDPADLPRRIRWSKNFRRPVIGVRWGVGVIQVSGDPLAKVADAEALPRYAGPVGVELVNELQQRITAGKFGAWPADAGPLGQPVPLGLKTRAELLDSARRLNLDLLLCVNVAQQRVGAKPDTVLRVRLVRVADDETLWTSEMLSAARAAVAQQRGLNLPAQWVAQVMAQIDATLLLDPMIVLKPEQAQRRAERLVADPSADKLVALMELRYYHSQKLLNDVDAAADIDKLLTPGAGGTMLGPDQNAKHELLLPLVDQASPN
jgi:hypothetical protein